MNSAKKFDGKNIKNEPWTSIKEPNASYKAAQFKSEARVFCLVAYLKRAKPKRP